MAKFISRRHFSLDFFGDEWKDCFVVLSSLSVNESRELMAQKLQSKEAQEVIDISITLLKDHFLEGVAFDSESKTLVKLKRDDLGELPSPFIESAILFLVGGTSLKSG